MTLALQQSCHAACSLGEDLDDSIIDQMLSQVCEGRGIRKGEEEEEEEDEEEKKNESA